MMAAEMPIPNNPNHCARDRSQSRQTADLPAPVVWIFNSSCISYIILLSKGFSELYCTDVKKVFRFIGTWSNLVGGRYFFGRITT